MDITEISSGVSGKRSSSGWSRMLALVIGLTLVLASGPTWAVARPAQRPLAIQEGLSGPVIVLLQDEADTSRVIRESSVATPPRQVYSRAIRGFAADLSAAEVQRLARDPRVRAITPDLPVYAQDQALPTGVDRIDADRNGVAKIDGNDTRVNAGIAILDSGIDPSHPDLNVAGGTDCTGSGGYADPNGHGTHVAGIVAALDNGIGTVGVAPGARLYAVRVLRSDLGGNLSSVICGLDWAVANRDRVDVVNMSFAGTGSDQPCGASAYRQAICNTVNAGVTIVVAAGNFSRDAATTAPATYPEVIAVSAFADYNGRPGGGASPNCSANYGDADDTFASYSNFGSDVDIAAPGTCIRSSSPGGGTTYKSGTSMASPHVAGAAALYLAGSPGASPGAVRSYLLSQGQSQSSTYGFTGDPDGAREPVLYVGTGYTPSPPTATPRPTSAPSVPTATPGSGGRTIRGGGGSATATPRPGVTPQPTTSVPPTSPPTSGGRTIRGGGGAAPTQPPSTGNPTATPNGSRTIRGSIAGSGAGGDGTGGTDGGSRVIRGAPTPTATVAATSQPTATATPVTAAVAPTATMVPPTATAVPPTATPEPPPPTATAVPPTETPVPPTETVVPPTATEEPLPTETPEPPTATPTLPPYVAAIVTDNMDSEFARYAVDGDPTTAWYADALTPESAVEAEDATPGVEAAGSASNEVFLELDLGETLPVGTIRWSFVEPDLADLYEVQVSLDGETWQTVTVRENPTIDEISEWQEQYVGASTRYVRFLFSNPNGDPVLGGLNEVEVYAA